MTTMTDRELLELAAKAAGVTLRPVEIKNIEFQGDDRWIGYRTDSSQWARGWFDPLADDGDAFRLAVKLSMSVEISEDETSTYAYAGDAPRAWAMELWRDDRYAATRRAIVRAAAAIGAKS
jgi:hypothetical protein